MLGRIAHKSKGAQLGRKASNFHFTCIRTSGIGCKWSHGLVGSCTKEIAAHRRIFYEKNTRHETSTTVSPWNPRTPVHERQGGSIRDETWQTFHIQSGDRVGVRRVQPLQIAGHRRARVAQLPCALNHHVVLTAAPSEHGLDAAHEAVLRSPGHGVGNTGPHDALRPQRLCMQAWYVCPCVRVYVCVCACVACSWGLRVPRSGQR